MATDAPRIRVAVAGAAGRMGQAVCAAVEGAEDLELGGQADPALGVGVGAVLDGADVLVDFTRPDQAVENARAALASGVHVVIGTTGFALEALHAVAAQAAPARGGLDAGGAFGASASASADAGAGDARPANAFWAPNFAIGAVLMMRFAAEAARHMRAAEIVELHHPAKLDAPSGTAARTAELMRPMLGEVPIHSVRLPGVVADQEVIFGDEAQTLTIRHATTDRTSFMPGVLLAVRGVAGLTESPVVGLERLLWPD